MAMRPLHPRSTHLQATATGERAHARLSSSLAAHVFEYDANDASRGRLKIVLTDI